MKIEINGETIETGDVSAVHVSGRELYVGDGQNFRLFPMPSYEEAKRIFETIKREIERVEG